VSSFCYNTGIGEADSVVLISGTERSSRRPTRERSPNRASVFNNASAARAEQSP
jgi:hypothetical protein